MRKLAFVCLSLLFLRAAHAQEARPLLVEEALTTRSFNATQIGFSPDGKRLAYTVRDQGQDSVIRSDIYLFDAETGETRNLPGAKGANWGPSWSPDGRYLAFFSDRDGAGRLWIWDVSTRELRKILDVNAMGTTIQWTPDSQRVAVAVPSSGDSRPESDAGKTQTPSSGRPNGSTVIVYRSGAAASHKEVPEADPWKLNARLRDLIFIDPMTGQTDLILHGRSFATYRISPDGSRIAYTSPKRFERPGSQQIFYDLNVLTLDGMKEQIIASDIRLDFLGDFTWSPKGRHISFATNGSGLLAVDCYVVDLRGGLPRNITMFPPLKESSWLSNFVRTRWSTNGDYVYLLRNGALWRAAVSGGTPIEVSHVLNHQFIGFVGTTPGSDNVLETTDRGRSTVVVTYDDLEKQEGFFRIDLTNGQSTKLLENHQCYYRCTTFPGLVSRDGKRVVYLAQDVQHDFDLWLTDSGFGSQQRLTHLNPQFDKYKMGSARLIDWLGEDGERLQGALLLPSEYEEGKRYPLIVSVYGGILQTRNLNQFGFLAGGGPGNMQLLATRGYAVLLPDSEQHLGTPMPDLAKSVLPGVNKVVELGIADPDRVGVMGSSYGGYCTLALIVQTKRFRAAVEAAGFADLVGNYGQMNKDGGAFGIAAAELGQAQMGGPPWEYPQRYLENSPIFYLDRVQTPLLILHGSDDSSVAPFLGDEVFVGLRRLGKEVEYAKYTGEGHIPSTFSLANQMDFCNRLIAWFDKYLRLTQK